MKELLDIHHEGKAVFHKAHQLIEKLRKLIVEPSSNSMDQIKKLRSIRKNVYEDLNQIQHEHLLISAIGWLVNDERFFKDVKWSWNPRQTGDRTEPDIRGQKNEEIIISAEATTSEAPVGSIDKRMKGVLNKLNEMDGEKFYFVSTKAMKQRAKTKIEKLGYDIAVVLIET